MLIANKFSTKSGILVLTLISVILAFSVDCKKKESLKIENDWVSETIPGNRVSAAYMDIINPSEIDDALLSADTELFEIVEFHNMFEEDGVMKMEPMDFVPVKSGQIVKFAPGGMHMMLINNKRAIKSGEKIQINLQFEKAGLVTRTFAVKNLQGQVE